MPRTPSPLNRMAGIVTMKRYFSMDNLSPAITQHTLTGMYIIRRPIPLNRLDLSAAVNFLRSRPEALTTRGSMEKTCTAYTTIYFTFCQMTFQERFHSESPRILSPAKWPVWLSMACLTPRTTFSFSLRYGLRNAADDFR
jgi:hypothetical protein